MTAPDAKGVGFATRRFITYTILILGLGTVYVFAATIGAVAIARLGSWYEGYYYPAMRSMEAQVRDPVTNQLVYKTFPPFQIEEMRWVGEDLLLVKGTLCKAEEYQFVAAHWFFGRPDGFKVPAEYQVAQRQGTRGVGCQQWNNWTLIGAGTSGAEHFYADIVYRPQHNLWNVTYRLGPYRIPPKQDGNLVPPSDF